MKRALLFLLALLAGPAAAQTPPPVPALPDSPRLTSYSLSSSTCACSVGFAIYGDGTDVDNWIDVFVNGVSVPSADPAHGWSLSSATGALGSIPRPITNAVLTFAQPQTGTVNIVGARRPRRLTQFQEGRGVTARDLNQVMTDLTAMERERWDAVNSTLRGLPGEVVNPLPNATARAGRLLAFDGFGQPIVTASSGGGGGGTDILHTPNTWTDVNTFQKIITVPANDVLFGIVTVQKTVNFTAPGGDTNAYAAIYGTNTVRDGTWSNQVGISGVVSNFNTQHSQGDPGGTASAVGISGAGICQVAGCSATWGGLIAAYDTSGQTTSPHPLVGLEVNVFSHGGNSVLLLLAGGTPDFVPPLPLITTAIAIGPSNGATLNVQNILSAQNVTATNGIVLNGATISGFAYISNGASIDGGGNSVFTSTQLSAVDAASLPICGSAQRGKVIYVINASTAPSYNNPVPAAGGGGEGKALCRNSTWVWG